MATRRFCGKDAIKARAGLVSFRTAWNVYKNSTAPHGKSCTYSLETGKFYDGDMPKDRKDLVELYGDGGTLYIIAPWTNPEEELDEDRARDVCENIVGMGYVPFIGIWHFGGRLHEEPSFAIDHGITEKEAHEMLARFGQMAAYRARYGRAERIGRRQ